MYKINKEEALKSLKVIGESMNVEDFYELVIYADPLATGAVVGYDKNSHSMYMVEYVSVFGEEDESFIDECIEDRYVDSDGRECVALNEKFLDITDRATFPALQNFIDEIQDDEEAIKLIDRAILEYMI